MSELIVSGKLTAIIAMQDGSKRVIYNGVECNPDSVPLTALEQLEVDSVQYIPDVPPTTEQVIADFAAGIQRRLDDFARTRNYDNILSACTYATSSVPKFAAEGKYCVSARDATWNTCYSILADVQTNARPMPTFNQIISELPDLVFPPV